VAIEQSQSLRALYHDDETAWLGTMAQLAAERRVDELDLENLSAYLSDMAGRDRREVLSRLTEPMAHLLKWTYQPERRSRSWQLSILKQRRALNDLLRSDTLRNYAEECHEEAYRRAVKQAIVETGQDKATYPADCPFTLDEILADE
jgi:uncharacterized protein with von Willebrand factor type A (vWA) domain